MYFDPVTTFIYNHIMNITILCAGKIKEKFYTDAVNEYLKRLSRYAKVSITEVPDEKTPDGASEKEQELIVKKEGDRMLKHITSDAWVVALTPGGKEYASPAFSSKIERLGIAGKSSIIFVIGGSLGLSREVLERSDEQIGFGPMTFPHQLFRVMLLEQIYRAYRIMMGEPYHK